MSGTITTGNYPKLLWPGVNQIFGDVHSNYVGEHSVIFKKSMSDKRFEEDQHIVNMGLATELGEGDAVSYDSARQGFTKRYTHVNYAKGFVITRIMLDDVQYGMDLATRHARMIANSLNQTKEIVAANVLNNGFDSTYTGGDAKELLATDHPLYAGGGTQKNELTTAADLSEASLEQALIDIGSSVDDAGLKIALRANKLIVPIDLQFTAERILHSTKRVDTADNDLNAISSMSMLPGNYAVNHYLTDADAWFILVDGCDGDGLRHFQRKAYELTMDTDFNTDNLRCKATERYSFGWSDWRAIFGSPGA